MLRAVPATLGVIMLAASVVTPQVGRVPPEQPTTRRIAVGTATITGTVTSADTGRPVRGARVTVNGTTGSRGGARGATPTSAPAPTPGLAPPVPGSAVGGLRGGSAGSGSFIMSASRTAVTDAQGSFVIEKLPAGQYTVNVTRNAFLSTTYGQRRPGGPGTAFALADGQKATVDLKMIRGGVISGRVFGEDGDPIGGAQIRVARYTTSMGTKRLQQTNGATTDDRGEYRVFGLQPGEYLVAATPTNSEMMFAERQLAETVLIEQAIASGAITPPSAPGQPATVTIPVMTGSPMAANEGPPPGYLPVYYPSTPAPASATVVRVAGGDEHPNVDIMTRLVQATNIQGTVANMPGAEMAVQLQLVNDDPIASDSMFSTRADANGRFTFRTVAPGKYTIVAQVVSSPTMTMVNGMMQQPPGPPRQLDDSQKWWGRTVVTVEGQPTIGASVTLRPGRSISGLVVFDMARPPDLTRSRLSVSLQFAPGVSMSSYGPQPQAEVGPDGRFTLNGIGAGRYAFRAPSGFMKSAVVNGEDTLDTAFIYNGMQDVNDVVLTVTDKVTEISGALTDASGKPATDYTVIAAAAEERYWTPGSRRVAVWRTSADGMFTLRGLPPGTYLLAAVVDLEPGGQFDPEFLKTLAAAGAMRVTVAEGAKLSQDLRIR